MTQRTWVVVLAVALALSVGFTAGYVVRGSSDAAPPAVDRPVAAVSVPNVVGLAAADATSVVEAAGLSVQIRVRADQVEPSGVVLEQTPPPGVRVPPGTVVNVVVSEA